MKKILGVLFVFVFSLFTFISCEDPPPPIPDCEQYGYGEVIVVNSTGYDLKVDVTYTSTGVNYEKWLNNGSSSTYEMDKGTVYIWGSFDGVEWVYDTYYLKACEELTYKWYLNKKKSTNNIYLVVSDQYGNEIKTVTEFETIKRDL